MMLLNLTSPDVHATLKLRAYIAVARTVTVTLLLAIVAFTASAVGGRYILQKHAADKQQEAERSTLLLNTLGQASITETTKKLNAQVLVLQKIQQRYVQWSPIIAEFSALTPDGITITSVQLSQSTGKLTFEAKAKTRDAYVAFEKILQANPKYSDVEFELQTKKTDITFSHSVTIVGIPKL